MKTPEELKISVSLQVHPDTKQQILLIEFGKELSWVGLDKTQALQLSGMMKALAETLP